VIRPSKKVLSIFIITIALVVAIIIGFGRDKSSQAINYASNLVVGEKVSIPENPNWQSELGGIALPAQAGQNTTSSSTGDSVTDTISKSLISNYLALKQSGTLDNTSAQNLVDQTINLFDQTGDKTVLTTELNIIPDNGTQSMIEYGENLGNVLKNNRPKEIIDEREIIKNAISSKDSSKLNELDSVIAVYEKIASDLMKTPVPQTFVKAHLDMVNGAKSMAIALKEIKTVFNDPIKGLQTLELYNNGVTIFVEATRATRDFINKNNIVYKQGSGGYYLLYGI